ncbi:ABC transporter permease [Desulfolithobacter sp.]
MKPPLNYLISKAFRLSLIVTLVAVLSFVLVSFAPLDPVTAYLGYDRLQISQEQKENIISRWGLDKSPPERFAAWATNIVKGDFGRSVIFNEPVTKVIAKRFSASFWLMFLAWLLSGLLGFVLGALAGTFRDSLADRIIRLYAYTMASTPTFWVAMILLVFFGVKLGWFPICCAGPLGVAPEDVSFTDRIYHLALPVLTLSLVGIAQITLHTREKMIDFFQSNHALYARACGETRSGTALFHGLRNILLPAITLQFASLGELFSGSVLAEVVFSYPGLGKATVDAGIRGDVPLLLGIVIFSTIFVVTGNLLADLLYRLVDPRIRMEEAI